MGVVITYEEHVKGLSGDQFDHLAKGQAEIKSLLNAFGSVLQQIIQKENQLIVTTDEAVKIIQATKDLTDKQGVALQAEGDTLQKISDKFDELVANGTVPAELADALSPLFKGVQAVSNTIDEHAALSTAILSKGTPTPPVPAPTPDPTVP